jgi:ADP-ribose pyrophosphatase
MSPETLEKKLIFKGRYFSVTQEKARISPGKAVDRTVVRHNGAAIIVPQDSDGSLLMVRQYRYAPDKTLLEFPAGTLEPGEAPLACAQREIQEEAGCAASEWIALGVVHPAPGFCDEVQHAFLARGLTPAQAPLDEDEIIEVERHSPAEIERMIAGGEITDGKTLAVYLYLKMKGHLA